MSEETILDEATDPLVRLIAEKLEADARNHLRIRRRVDLIVWIGIGILLLALLTVVLRSINYYELRGQVDAKSEQLAGVTESNTELTRRLNRLRGELALRDARFLASKGVVQKGGRLEDLLAIQGILDRFAIERLKNGAAQEMISDDVRREACVELERAGYSCIP